MALNARLLLLILCALAGGPAVADVTGDYVYQRGTSLVNLNLNAQGKSIAGYFLVCNRDVTKLDGTRVHRMPVVGSITGSNLRVSGSQEVVWTGTVKGGLIRIKWPLDSGELQEVRFQRISAKAWNTKLAEFKRVNYWHAYQYKVATTVRERLSSIAGSLRYNGSEVEKQQARIKYAQERLTEERKELAGIIEKITACEKALKDQEAEVRRLEGVYATSRTDDNWSKLEDGRSKLIDCRTALSDAQADRRDTESKVKRYEKDVATADEEIKLTIAATALLQEEAKLLSTNSIRAYFDRGELLPLKQIPGNGLGIYKRPDATSERMYTTNGTDVIFGFQTAGDWYAVLLANGTLGWMKK